MARNGRKPDYSEADKARIADEVIEMMMEKRWPMSKALKAVDGACSYSEWLRWVAEKETLSIAVARAREASLEALIEDMIELSRNEKLDHQSRRVQIIAIEKAAQMLLPRRFGPRLDVTSGGEKIAQPETARLDRIEGLIALAASRAQAKIEGKVIDITPEPDPDINDLMD